jgi:D-lyxose ketol-isomerase
MKRSEINQKIKEAIQFFEAMNFKLPPWGTWSPEEWKWNRSACTEIFENGLGWDLTDFGTGRFSESGLILFTIRNGNITRDKKTYAEKIMIVDENQLTPTHFHWSKMEDIINRGGGNLVLELFPSDENEEIADHAFQVSTDGMVRTLQPGDKVILTPGESITLYQGLYHNFYGEPGKGKVLVGEVSSVNDDDTDNNFLDAMRFPEIDEDEPPAYLLAGDYKGLE